ncbi:hypothetical protein GCM10011344_34140 [Dokdonia pacifica]|uniref:Uncharacterized protein n=1 Tax=Dokdonia pacifica TaxID=1627892 RepID=A0A239BBD6_9FLAO|nr:DUF6588 family protein [Dokdonia pacifica]GGG30369.1 hypothetical protein GCM10011344_34140 [Dokdonia pacifica]SNS04989.1 hypothetical protein SAMN06265376_10641 [Dokdonia pacifica]
MQAKILLMLSFLGSTTLLFSQNNLLETELILSDMLLISERYVAPGADAAAYQATGGWASTAKSLELFEIDASVHVNALFIPNRRRSFTVANSDFNALRIRGGETASIPTVLGGDTAVFFDFELGGEPNELQAYEGINENQLYHPFLQASIGLWKETDLTVRYSPDIAISDTEYGILGLGVKHSVSQYFNRSQDQDGAIKNQLEVAVQVAYSRFNSGLTFDPFQIEDPDAEDGDSPLLLVNQLDVEVDSWLFQTIASKRYQNFEFFGGVGVVFNDARFIMNGEPGLVLGLLNSLLGNLDASRTVVKGDVGVNYHIGDFYLSNAFTFGEFANYNLSIHYKI